jgi:hypothetical protein
MLRTAVGSSSLRVAIPLPHATLGASGTTRHRLTAVGLCWLIPWRAGSKNRTLHVLVSEFFTDFDTPPPAHGRLVRFLWLFLALSGRRRPVSFLRLPSPRKGQRNARKVRWQREKTANRPGKLLLSHFLSVLQSTERINKSTVALI